MDLLTRTANAAVHQRLADLAAELDDGSAPHDLALSEIRAYQQALRHTRAALAEALGRAGYHWQADPGRVRLQAAL